MADIELVIKLSEEDFEIIKHNIAVDNPLCPIGEKEMVTKIANGIPLPKGHGRLIDADALLNNSNIYDIWLNGVYEDCILTDVINNASTIIEADKE